MKKLLTILFGMVSAAAQAQTFPVQNLQVNGTSAFVGLTTAQSMTVNSVFTANGTVGGSGITALLAPYAPLLSPTFTGIPSAPTASPGTNTTQIATTAFVQALGMHFTQTGVVGISVNTSLTSTQANNMFRFSGNNVTATLPALSSMTNGQTFSFTAPGSYGSTILPNGGDVIWPANSTGALSSFPVASGESVTFTAQPGTGWFVQGDGTATAAQSCVSVLQYGADRTGVSASDNAVTAALNDPRNAGNTKCVEFGAGKYLLNSGIAIAYTASLQSVTIRGMGQDSTQIIVPTSVGGMYFNLKDNTDSFHVRDLSITTSGVNGNFGISTGTQAASIPNPANSALNDVTNVTIRGSDGYAQTNYFNTAIIVAGVSNINFDGVEAFGPSSQSGLGMSIVGTSSLPPVQFNIAKSMFNSFNTGASFGNYTQGITVSQSNFVADRTCISVPSGATGMDQLTIVNSQFACGVGLNIQAQYQNLMVAHNLFILQNFAGVYGIYNTAAVLYSIIGNTFQNANAPNLGNNPQGIYLNNDSGVGGVISGNVFRYMSPAIYLDTATSGANVQSNAYFNNNVNVSNHGTNTIGGGSQ